MNKTLGVFLSCMLVSTGFVSSNSWKTLEVSVSPLTNGDTWSKTFGRFFSWEKGTGVQQTSDGGYIVVGYTDSNGPDGIWLIKLDSDGNKEWERFLRGYESGNVEQTIDGGYIIAATEREVFLIIKTDSLGNAEWCKSLDIVAYIGGDEVVHQTIDGGYIVMGNIVVADDSNACLIKLDRNGSIEWSKVFGNSNYWENGYSVTQTDDNGYIFVGEYFSSETNRGGVWLVKVNSSGDEEWNKTFGYPCSFPIDYGFSVQQTSDGGYIIASNNVSRYPTGWVIKTDRYGNKEWEVSPEFFLYSVDQTIDGGYIAVGTTGNLLTPGNLHLVKISSSGIIEWTREYGRESSNGNDYYHESGRCVRQTRDRGYIIVGYRDSSLLGSLMNTWNIDIWVLKTDRNGGCESLVSGKTSFIYRLMNIYMGGVI